MISLAFVAFIGLMLFSYIISYQWVKAKSRLTEVEEQFMVTKNVLLREQQNREVEKRSYEDRLSAKQGEIDALKKYILSHIGNSGAVDFISGMFKDADSGGEKP